MDLIAAYEHCRRITEDHYENFPVASLLVPPAIRPAIQATYAFARGADDVADEGQTDSVERLRELDEWGQRLDRCVLEPLDDPVFLALGDTLRRQEVPIQLYHDLLSAFRQDVTTKRYRTFDDVLDYCRRSANPVGRIVLWLFGYRDEGRARYSDSICTALQLANFWQDISVDLEKGRIYIPSEDWSRFGVTEADLLQRRSTEGFRHLVRFQIERTQALFDTGKPLPDMVISPLSWELRLVWLGGTRIMDHVRRGNYETLHWRPKLSKWDWIRLVLQSAFAWDHAGRNAARRVHGNDMFPAS